MRITITKGAGKDAYLFERTDGSYARSCFPHKAPIPHDIVHLEVEAALGFKNGFIGMVAAGVEPADIAAYAKEHGHASSSRAQMPNDEIIELLQAERLVECFEAEIMGAPSDYETFIAVLETACAASHIEAPALTQKTVEIIRENLTTFKTRWLSLTIGESVTVEWNEI